jgi:hypothetical protein
MVAPHSVRCDRLRFMFRESGQTHLLMRLTSLHTRAKTKTARRSVARSRAVRCITSAHVLTGAGCSVTKMSRQDKREKNVTEDLVHGCCEFFKELTNIAFKSFGDAFHGLERWAVDTAQNATELTTIHADLVGEGLD